MRHFDSLEQIREADVEELREVPGMNERSAREVVSFFKKREVQDEI